MMDRFLKSTTLPLMQRMLNLASTRQRVIAANIANIQTPNYRQQEVDFDASLQEATQRLHIDGLLDDERHMPLGEPAPQNENVVITQREQNSSVEKEMALAAENQFIYSTATKIVSGNFRNIRAAIRGRV